MKKIVINSCFGEFALSATAIARIAELQGKKAYFFEVGLEKMVPISIEEADKTFASAFYTPTPPIISTGDFLALSDEESVKWNADYEASRFQITGRDDPFLVQAVEELGGDSGTKISALKVIEIPDDVDWEIEEYDGSEWVSEKHRTWR